MKRRSTHAPFQRITRLFACGVLLTTSSVWGVDNHQKQIDWESSLNLSIEQQTQIEAIENKYRDKLQAIRSNKEASKEDNVLYTQMREEIRTVLTVHQQALAEEQVRQRETKGRQTRLDHLARTLGLSEQQQIMLREKLASCEEEEWPVSVEKRDEDRKRFERAIKSVLTEEQNKDWTAIQHKERERWRHHDFDRIDEPVRDDDSRLSQTDTEQEVIVEKIKPAQETL